MSSVNLETIESWLRAIGCHPKRLNQGPPANWELEFDYPANTTHRMYAFNPQAAPRSLVVGTKTAISADHAAAFARLEDLAKINFLRALQKTLNRDSVEFGVEVEGRGLVCPKAFHVTATRYDDGLTLDSLARSVSSVYKTEVAGVLCVQQHLNPAGHGAVFPFMSMGPGVQ